MTRTERATRKAGRPRSLQSRQAILDATLALLLEDGFEAMSIESIATRAGVGKTTIYRWWSSKEELVIELIDGFHTEMPIIDTGNLRDDLTAIGVAGTSQQSMSLMFELWLKLIDVMRSNPDLFQVFYERVLAPRLHMFTQFVERAKVRGELRQDIDPLFAVDLLSGPLLYYFLFSSLLPPPSPELPSQIIDAILNGIATSE